MFSVGPAEIALLFGVALLLFGPKKLPELGKALGQGIGNFKKSIGEAQDEVKSAMSVDARPGDTKEPAAAESGEAKSGPSS